MRKIYDYFSKNDEIPRGDAEIIFGDEFLKVPLSKRVQLGHGAKILYYNLSKMVFLGGADVHERRVHTTYKALEEMLMLQERQIRKILVLLKSLGLVGVLLNPSGTHKYPQGTVVIEVFRVENDENDELVPIL